MFEIVWQHVCLRKYLEQMTESECYEVFPQLPAEPCETTAFPHNPSRADQPILFIIQIELSGYFLGSHIFSWEPAL